MLLLVFLVLVMLLSILLLLWSSYVKDSGMSLCRNCIIVFYLLRFSECPNLVYADQSAPTSFAPTLWQLIENDPELSIFARKTPSTVEIVWNYSQSAPITIFTPIDSAWTNDNASNSIIEWWTDPYYQPHWHALWSAHIIPEIFSIDRDSPPVSVQSFWSNDTLVISSVDTFVRVEAMGNTSDPTFFARVTDMNVPAINGILHKIDRVLIPSDLLRDTLSLLRTTDEFDLFYRAVVAEDLESALQQPCTILSPTIEALQSQHDKLFDVAYHIISSPVPGLRLTTGASLTTVSGEEIIVTDRNVLNGSARIVKYDTITSQSYIHTIDSVLTPPLLCLSSSNALHSALNQSSNTWIDGIIVRIQLCPNTRWTEPVTLSSNVILLCGVNGSIDNNCTWTGAALTVHQPVYNVTILGMTFVGDDSELPALAMNHPGEVTIRESSFQNYCNAIHLMQPDDEQDSHGDERRNLSNKWDEAAHSVNGFLSNFRRWTFWRSNNGRSTKALNIGHSSDGDAKYIRSRLLDRYIPPEAVPSSCILKVSLETPVVVEEVFCPDFCGPSMDMRLTVTTSCQDSTCRNVIDCTVARCNDDCGSEVGDCQFCDDVLFLEEVCMVTGCSFQPPIVDPTIFPVAEPTSQPFVRSPEPSISLAMPSLRPLGSWISDSPTAPSLTPPPNNLPVVTTISPMTSTHSRFPTDALSEPQSSTPTLHVRHSTQYPVEQVSSQEEPPEVSLISTAHPQATTTSFESESLQASTLPSVVSDKHVSLPTYPSLHVSPTNTPTTAPVVSSNAHSSNGMKLTIDNCSFERNRHESVDSPRTNGIIVVHSTESTLLITNSVFRDNSFSSNGYAVLVDGTAFLQLVDNCFIDNDFQGPTVVLRNGSDVTAVGNFGIVDATRSCSFIAVFHEHGDYPKCVEFDADMCLAQL